MIAANPPPLDREGASGLALGFFQGLTPGAALLDANQRALGTSPRSSPSFERFKYFGQAIGGLALTAFGMGGSVGGIGLNATGIGALVGVPALAVSSTVITAGVANTLAGWQGLWQSLATGGSSGPPGVSAGPAAPVAGSQSKLAKAMHAAGMKQPPNTDAHHIVARNAPDAAQARAILQKFGIGIDEADNGVFLPSNKVSPNPNGSAVHRSLHTGEYYGAVERALEKATSKDELINILKGIRHSLENGGYP